LFRVYTFICACWSPYPPVSEFFASIRFDIPEHCLLLVVGPNESGKTTRLRARAFVVPADVMLLDEPTSDLDEPTEKHVIQRLLDMRSQCAIVWVHHDIFRALRIADRVMDGQPAIWEAVYFVALGLTVSAASKITGPLLVFCCKL
jgi:ABC-type cobalamin/Fe3+-siderophores transport system ATPase subunit